MSDYSDAIDDARAAMDAVAADILPDLCDLFKPGTEARDSYGEIITPTASAATSVPCAFRALSAYEQTRGGAVMQEATHVLTIPYNATTAAIAGDYTGTVAARGVAPAFDFTVTGALPKSTALLLRLAVTVKG